MMSRKRWFATVLAALSLGTATAAPAAGSAGRQTGPEASGTAAAEASGAAAAEAPGEAAGEAPGEAAGEAPGAADAEAPGARLAPPVPAPPLEAGGPPARPVPAPPLSSEDDGRAGPQPVPATEPPDDVLVVAGVSVRPGEKREIRLATSESFAATDVDIPVVVIRGKEPGPILCLVAGIHGDELNGTEIVREILETHRPEDLRGTVIGVPIVNLFGFTNQSRYLPDRRDLNRHFPGRSRGSTASRIAYRVWNGVMRRCTHLIDFHTGSLHRSNLAQVRGDLRDPRILELARSFGSRVIVHNPGQQGTLRSTAAAVGIPSILYEAGETMRFQKTEIRKGVLGVRNTMVQLAMRKGRRVDLGPQTLFLETHWVRAEQGGILELYPALGEWVNEGDILGVITDPLRKEKGVVVSPYRGRVIGKVLSPMVIPGLAVLHIGVVGGRMEDTEAGAEEAEGDRPE